MSVRQLALVGLGGAVLLVSACTPMASAQLDTVAPSTDSRAQISAAPTGEKKVDPDEQITVRATDGRLAEVVVTGPQGPIPGELSDDGTVWTAAASSLALDSRYTLEATAIDPRGVPTTTSESFRTKAPRGFYSAVVSPRDGATVGVGMPITVTFDRGIKDKEAVERALVVYTPTPIKGAWSWNGDTQVQFRPKKYWPGNIDVTVGMNLEGVEGARRVYGKEDSTASFSVGPRMVTQVNAATHTASIFRDGERIRSIPITTGKAGFETRSGIKVVVSKERTRVMDAATGGTDPNDPEYYNLEVEYAMRVTYSGEFLHAAPWSVGSQGYANVSHGCVGMSTANAEWLYNLTNVGDVVEVTGTTAVQNLGNGITVWNESWDQWLEGSKTGMVMTVAAPTTLPAPTDPPTDAPADGSSEAPTTPEPSPSPSEAATGVQQASYGR